MGELSELGAAGPDGPIEDHAFSLGGTISRPEMPYLHPQTLNPYILNRKPLNPIPVILSSLRWITCYDVSAWFAEQSAV